MGELIAFRALQGLGAGGLMVGAQAIIAEIVPPRDRGRYMGLIGSVFAVASVAGPLLGGFFVETLSWRWVFYVNMPIGVLAVLVVVFRLHLHVPTHRHQIDYLGATLLTAGVSALILVTTWGGNEYAWGSPTIVAPGRRRRRAARRSSSGRRAAPPSRSSRSSSSARAVFSVASSIGFVIGLAMFGAIIFIPLFLQLVYGVSPTSSGLRMLPLMAGLLTASILSGRAISRIGRYKVFPVVGTAVTTVGLFLLSRLEVDTRAVAGVGLHARARRRHRPRDAGDRARRPERRAAARHRRRHLDRDVLPQHGRLARRRAVRRDLRLAPRRASSRRCPATRPRSSAAASTSARTQVHALAPEIRHDFLLAFVNALQPVFLVGAARHAGRVRARLAAQGGPAARHQPRAAADPVTDPDLEAEYRAGAERRR